LSANNVQLQLTKIWQGLTQVIILHTTSVVPATSVLHWPYRNTLQQVDRLPQLSLAQ